MHSGPNKEVTSSDQGFNFALAIAVLDEPEVRTIAVPQPLIDLARGNGVAF